MSREVVLVLVESGAVQETIVLAHGPLEVMVVDWDDLEIDPDACSDLLEQISDLPDTENMKALRERLNKTIEDDEEYDETEGDDDGCCPECGDPDCCGECMDEDNEPDDSMDGDHETGLASAGFGTDEDYGG